MNTILVPVDFSEISDNAMQYAAGVAVKTGASILLLHTYHAGEITLDPHERRKTKDEREIRQESDVRLSSLVTVIHKAGARASYLTEFGPLIEIMCDLVRSRNVSLVIMGTAGSKGYLDLLFGTKAARIIEKVNCPVIAVPGNCMFNGMSTIVFATDFHDNDLSIMRFLARFAALFNASLRMIHVSKSIDANEHMLEKFRKDALSMISYENLSFEVFNGENVSEELENYILETGADLLVMSTHHRGPFDHLFETSKTRQIAQHAHIPLLAFHYKDEPTYFF